MSKTYFSNRSSRARLALALAVGASSFFSPARPAHAAGGVVQPPCNEAAYDAVLGPNGGGLVTFNCGAGLHTIVLTSSKLILFDTTIDGGGAITLSGGNGSRIFRLDTNTSLTLENLTLKLGNASGADIAGDGGCIWSDGLLTLNHVDVESCHAIRHGGALFNYTNGRASVNNSTLQKNTAEVDCGAICDYGQWLSVSGSAIVSNTAVTGNVGGIGSAGTFTITDSLLLSNTAAHAGGALYSNLRVTLANVTLIGNQAVELGGGLFNGPGSRAVISRTLFENNRAPRLLVGAWGGGAIYTVGQLVLEQSVLKGNYAGAYGGGVWQNGGTATIAASSFLSNTTDGNAIGGGGLAVWSATAFLTNTTFAGNSSSNGGGIFKGGQNGRVYLTNSTLFTNSALYGGALSTGDQVTLLNTIVADNAATDNAATDNCLGMTQSLGFNISSDDSCGPAVFSDQFSTEPDLEPLGAHGGPLAGTNIVLNGSPGPSPLWVMAPRRGSPAIDRGTVTGCPPDDERGAPRPLGDTCDIGAVEYELLQALFLPLARR